MWWFFLPKYRAKFCPNSWSRPLPRYNASMIPSHVIVLSHHRINLGVQYEPFKPTLGAYWKWCVPSEWSWKKRTHLLKRRNAKKKGPEEIFYLQCLSGLCDIRPTTCFELASIQWINCVPHDPWGLINSSHNWLLSNPIMLWSNQRLILIKPKLYWTAPFSPTTYIYKCF